MNISLFFTSLASKLELGSNAHACINFHTSLAARHEEPLVCPRERDKVRILSRENCLQIRDCAIITWRGGWEMGEICPKVSHALAIFKQKLISTPPPYIMIILRLPLPPLEKRLLPLIPSYLVYLLDFFFRYKHHFK